ncbi:MAG: transcription termination factor Rho, partial [Candidatus Velthaea sp.]
PETGAPPPQDVFNQPEFPQPVGPPLLSQTQLDAMSKTELNELAKTFEIATPVKVKKDELVAQILEIQAQRSGLEVASGVLDVLPEGYGFLRRSGYLPGADDIYISQSQIRRFELRRGDLVAGQVRKPKENEKYYGIVKVESINGYDPEAIRERRTFDELTPILPAKRYVLAGKAGGLIGRAIDLYAPLAKGTRGLIVAPPRSGKTRIVKAVAAALAANAPETRVIVLLVDERPEDVTELSHSIDAEVVATSFDDHPDSHAAVAELALERAKRLVELGHDVVVLVDSMARLVRAYAGSGNGGRGFDPATLQKPKRFFGAARACEEGGSLAILATANTETGNRLDDAIVEELRGLANMEIGLSRTLADARIFPAIDLRASSARNEAELLSEIELRKIALLRRATARLGVLQAGEATIESLAKTKTNDDFVGGLTEKSVAALV